MLSWFPSLQWHTSASCSSHHSPRTCCRSSVNTGIFSKRFFPSNCWRVDTTNLSSQLPLMDLWTMWVLTLSPRTTQWAGERPLNMLEVTRSVSQLITTSRPRTWAPLTSAAVNSGLHQPHPHPLSMLHDTGAPASTLTTDLTTTMSTVNNLDKPSSTSSHQCSFHISSGWEQLDLNLCLINNPWLTWIKLSYHHTYYWQAQTDRLKFIEHHQDA